MAASWSATGMLANFTPRIMLHCGPCERNAQAAYTGLHYSDMHHIPIDEYVVDVLLPDLVGHDRSTGSFLVYLVLWTELYRTRQLRIPMSLRTPPDRTGLSKSAVPAPVRILNLR